MHCISMVALHGVTVIAVDFAKGSALGVLSLFLLHCLLCCKDWILFYLKKFFPIVSCSTNPVPRDTKFACRRSGLFSKLILGFEADSIELVVMIMNAVSNLQSQHSGLRPDLTREF